MIGMAIGALCLGITWFSDDALHTRFWSNFLHNSVFFTGISFMAAFFICICITAWAGWYTTFKRVWESMSMFLIVGLVLMLIVALGVYFGWNHLYHWADAESVANDKILKGKSGFLNRNFYLVGTVFFIGLWYFLISKIRALSVAEDTDGDSDFSHHHKMRVYAAVFLPIAGFTSAAMMWQWVMSIDAHWYSTMFAWYASASWFVAMVCLTVILILFLKGRGYFEEVSVEHMHDLGKFIFAFSIFWTYLWFSQYMLIWYANVGEETIYFKERMTKYPVLFYGNLLINFVLPFFVLMRNDTKRKYGSLGFIAGAVFLGHWFDFFQMIKPGVLHTAHELSSHGHGHGDAHGGGHGAEAGHSGHGHEAAHHTGEAAEHGSEFLMGFSFPGFLEIGTMIGFLCLFLFVFFSVLSRARLIPEKDPYLEESIHHHV
jgi:hypothetical protein